MLITISISVPSHHCYYIARDMLYVDPELPSFAVVVTAQTVQLRTDMYKRQSLNEQNQSFLITRSAESTGR